MSAPMIRNAARIIVRFMAGVEPQNSLSLWESVGGRLHGELPKVIKLIFSWWFPLVRFAPSPLPLSQRERESIFRRELLRPGFRAQPLIFSFPVRPSARASEA